MQQICPNCHQFVNMKLLLGGKKQCPYCKKIISIHHRLFGEHGK